MPTLSEQLLKKNNQLVNTSSEEAQALTGVPMTSPMQSASMGANPNQAKMVGTKAQKSNALRTAMDGATDLATANRREQAYGVATTAEQQRIQQAQQAQGLQGLQQSVQQAATQALQQGVQPVAGQKIQLKPVGEGLSVEQTALATALTDADPNNDKQALADYANKTGNLPTQDEISQLVGGVKGTAGIAGAAAAQSTANQINLKNLTPEIQSTANQLLGKDTSGMTVDQLLTEINQEIDKDYQQTNNLQTQLSDPMLGPAQRAEARKQLRNMGASGVVAAESQIDQLADKIANADTVQFNGQPMNTSDLLNDDFVAGTVANYLMDPSSETSKQLEKSEPQLVNFIKQYQGVLQPAVQALGKEVPAMAKIHANNIALSKVDLGNGQQLSVPKQLMDSLIPGWDKFNTKQLTSGQSGVLQALQNKNYSPQDRQGVLDTVTRMQSLNPAFMADIVKWRPEDIQKYFINDKDRVNSLINQYDAVSKIDPTGYNKDDVARAYGFDGADDMQSQVRESQIRGRSGLFADSGLKKTGIKYGQDGTINWDLTLNNLKQQTPDNLTQLITSGKKPITDVNSALKHVNGLPEDSGFYDALKPALMGDAFIDASEAKQIGQQLSNDDIERLLGNPTIGKSIDKEAGAFLTGAINNRIVTDLGNTINKSININGKQPKSLADLLTTLNKTTYDADAQSSEYQQTLNSVQNLVDGLKGDARKARDSGNKIQEKDYDILASKLEKGMGTLRENVSRTWDNKQTNVNTNIDFLIKDTIPGINSLDELSVPDAITPDNVDQVSAVIEKLKDKSRAARDSGDRQTEKFYDDKVSELETSIRISGEIGGIAHAKQEEEGKKTIAQKLGRELSGTVKEGLGGIGGAVSDTAKDLGGRVADVYHELTPEPLDRLYENTAGKWW